MSSYLRQSLYIDRSSDPFDDQTLVGSSPQEHRHAPLLVQGYTASYLDNHQYIRVFPLDNHLATLCCGRRWNGTFDLGIVNIFTIVIKHVYSLMCFCFGVL